MIYNKVNRMKKYSKNLGAIMSTSLIVCIRKVKVEREELK